jgi:hypothetical protein
MGNEPVALTPRAGRVRCEKRTKENGGPFPPFFLRPPSGQKDETTPLKAAPSPSLIPFLISVSKLSTMAPNPVPETVLRKRRRDEEWAAKRAAAAQEVSLGVYLILCINLIVIKSMGNKRNY